MVGNMTAREYVEKLMQLCKHYEETTSCSGCPLKSIGCGIPSNQEDAKKALDIVCNFNLETILPFGACINCGKEFNSEIICEYEATHCPWCGAKIERAC